MALLHTMGVRMQNFQFSNLAYATLVASVNELALLADHSSTFKTMTDENLLLYSINEL